MGTVGSGGQVRLNFWALTGTVDHALTENLIVKVEARYDIGNDQQGADDFFMGGGDGPDASSTTTTRCWVWCR